VKENYLQLALFNQKKHANFLNQSGTTTIHSVTFLSRAFRWLHVFPHLALGACFPALDTGKCSPALGMFSRAWR